MLSELEEIISYKEHMDEPERQATQRATWSKRSVPSIAVIPYKY